MKKSILLATLLLACIGISYAQKPNIPMPEGMRVIKQLEKGMFQVVYKGDTALFVDNDFKPNKKRIIYELDSAYIAAETAKGRWAGTKPYKNDKVVKDTIVSTLAYLLPCEKNLCYTLTNKENLVIETASFAQPFWCELTDSQTGKVLFSKEYRTPRKQITVPVGKNCGDVTVRSKIRKLNAKFCYH
ncbi:hypothetical protein SAMN05421780_111154 [Flexibacter flexilis DSM 6793]|uniref:GLPGLI family protein n=1 Tax=Flexibacter flexilis DSM 6793 TaxID=927664 RepID=A0A1I1N7U1_9BACT|nr:hypothetical protein [Flexibacter flexilis]SFC89800.1 hypothetical protein SAMN05421780_111154 [Flexibacter flexilis DSM 6793]